jgi:hypothetical protein
LHAGEEEEKGRMALAGGAAKSERERRERRSGRLGWLLGCVERRGERGRVWAGLGCLSFSPFLFLFLLLFYTQPIQTNLIEFKIQFEFKPINSTQITQCCSMNAQTI